MSYRSYAAEFARVSRQTKEFRAVLANGRVLERLCGEKTTVLSLEAK